MRRNSKTAPDPENQDDRSVSDAPVGMYSEAVDVEAIARELIPDRHPHLLGVKLIFSFRNTPTWVKQGQHCNWETKKVGARSEMAYLIWRAERLKDAEPRAFFHIVVLKASFCPMGDIERRKEVDKMLCSLILNERGDMAIQRPDGSYYLKNLEAFPIVNKGERKVAEAFAKTLQGALMFDGSETPLTDEEIDAMKDPADEEQEPAEE